jgi:hypothetical protein
MTGLVAEWHRMALAVHTAQVMAEHSSMVLANLLRSVKQLEERNRDLERRLEKQKGKR